MINLKLKSDFNLLPEPVKTQRAIRKALAYAFLGLVAVIALSAVSVVFMFGQLLSVNMAKSRVENQIASLKYIVDKQNAVNADKENYNKIMQYYKSIEAAQVHVYDFLKNFETIIPRDCQITGITISENGKLVVAGKAKNQTAVCDLENNLKDTGRFSSIFLDSVARLRAPGQTTASLSNTFNISGKFNVKDIPKEQPQNQAGSKATAQQGGANR